MREKTLKIFVLPDCHVKPNTPLEHLEYAGRWCAEKHVDHIVCLGDFADMESLSSYDVGKKSFEGRRYTNDIAVVQEGMIKFMAPIIEEINKLRRLKMKMWYPKFTMLLGNHENRISRAVNNDSKLDGLISIEDLNYGGWGWEVVPYLQVRVIEGVAFSHYFVSGVMGRSVGSARMLLTKHHMSCVAGHLQGKDLAYSKSADGRTMTAIIAGSYYQHEEEYLNAQTNVHWRGCFQLNDVDNGDFDELPLSLKYLKSKYGH